jgi:hypothetical protein
MLGLREAEVINVDHTRPLLLGYIRRHLLMTDAELDDARERLGLFAEIEGFTLGTVYVEHFETTPAAFEALVEAVNRYEVTAVVVPSMLHFALLSAPAAIKDRFEHITGARVMVAAESFQVRRAQRRAPD